MASENSLKLKKGVVDEIKNKFDSNKTFLILNYKGLTVSEAQNLRRSLREIGSDVKIYKNTLMNLALKDKNIKLEEYMEGPNAYVFSDSIIEPIKVISEFQKKFNTIEMRVGYIDKEVVNIDTLKEYATIPSLEGLYTMFAGGLIEHVRNLSIALNLYAENLEKGGEK